MSVFITENEGKGFHVMKKNIYIIYYFFPTTLSLVFILYKPRLKIKDIVRLNIQYLNEMLDLKTIRTNDNKTLLLIQNIFGYPKIKNKYRNTNVTK